MMLKKVKVKYTPVVYMLQRLMYYSRELDFYQTMKIID